MPNMSDSTSDLHDPEKSGEIISNPGETFHFRDREQAEKAVELAKAMAEKFRDHGASAEFFRIVRTINYDVGGDTLTVVYAASKGLDLGPGRDYHEKERSWKNIFDQRNRDKFVVSVDGREIDTRVGMTYDVYRGMISDARLRGEEIPDANNYTDTWLTGETTMPEPGWAPVCRYRADRGKIQRVQFQQNDNYGSLRFRPAAVIEEGPGTTIA